MCVLRAAQLRQLGHFQPVVEDSSTYKHVFKIFSSLCFSCPNVMGLQGGSRGD